MNETDYAELTLNGATMATITSSFGSPATATELQSAFGTNWLQTFIQFEPVGESCVWYLAEHNRTSRAFQLCFNGGDLLVDKQIINVSGTSGS